MSDIGCQKILDVCSLHAERMKWAMQMMEERLPFTVETIDSELSDMDFAVLDQFIARFAKLQDTMGAKLFPAVLDLTKEPGEFPAFIDKLNLLEKIGAIESADDWLLLREIRNQFSHDYPDDPELQAAILNKSFEMAKVLLDIFNRVNIFALKYFKVT